MNEIKKIKELEYFNLKAVSISFLRRFERSPAHAQTQFIQTEAMRIGQIFHMYILEPEKFENEFIIAPKEIPKDKRKKEYKDFLETTNKEIIFFEDAEKLKNAKENIYNYRFDEKKLEYYLSNSQNESTILFENQGIQCKGRIDALYEDEEKIIIFELKKVEDCTRFQFQVNNYKYYRQAAYYREGVRIIKGEEKKIRHIFVTVEQENPNGVKCFELDEEYFLQGMRENFISLYNFSNWDHKLNLYEEGIEILKKPNWLGT